MTIAEATTTATKTDWLAKAKELSTDFATRAAKHDADDSFVAENYAALKAAKLFSAPVPAELGGLGVTVRVAPLIRAAERYRSTAVCTVASVLLSKIPTRAPSRAAFVRICCTMTIRPYSIIPNTNKKNTGATTANSTTAAPRRPFARGAARREYDRANFIRQAPGAPEGLNG